MLDFKKSGYLYEGVVVYFVVMLSESKVVLEIGKRLENLMKYTFQLRLFSVWEN